MGVTGDQGNQRDASVGSSGKRGAYQLALAQGAREGTVNRRWSRRRPEAVFRGLAVAPGPALVAARGPAADPLPARTQTGERRVRPQGRRGGRRPAHRRVGERAGDRVRPGGRTGSSPTARSMSAAEDASLSVVAIPAGLPSGGPSGAWYRADSRAAGTAGAAGAAGAGARRIRLARCELSSLKSTSARTM